MLRDLFAVSPVATMQCPFSSLYLLSSPSILFHLPFCAFQTNPRSFNILIRSEVNIVCLPFFMRWYCSLCNAPSLQDAYLNWINGQCNRHIFYCTSLVRLAFQTMSFFLPISRQNPTYLACLRVLVSSVFVSLAASRYIGTFGCKPTVQELYYAYSGREPNNPHAHLCIS